MGLPIILTTLILNSSPDLCADVYVDVDGQPITDAVGQTLSRFCEQTGPSAPVLDLDVCCAFAGDVANCSLPDANGRCWAGTNMTYCEYGELTSTGSVACYQPLPSICDFGFCGDVMPPDAGPWEDDLCCWSNGCFDIINVDDVKTCKTIGGYLGYCEDGATKEDGTIECFD